MDRTDTGEPRGDQGSLRASNRDRVLVALRENGAISRAEIARRTGLSRSTVSSVVRDLTAAGMVSEGLAAAGAGEKRGRPAVPVTLDPVAGVALGIDVGHHVRRVAVCDLGHRILAEREAAADVASAEATLDAVAELSAEVLAEAGAEADRIVGAAMSLPAPIDTATGMIGAPYLLPGWAGVRIGDEISRRLGVHVRVENDANVSVLAESLWGAGKGSSDAVYLKWGAGIGCGLLIDGKLYRGARGTAGEVGHVTHDEHGKLCVCGNRGCIETVATAQAIICLLPEPQTGRCSIADVIHQARDGDRTCLRALADAGTVVGIAVANLCNVFNPSRVIVGGEVAQAGELVLGPVRRSVERCAVRSAADAVEIVPGVLGGRAEVLGTLAMVISESNVFAAPG
jgi:predicted NBD/HSP70 family sugar kinase/DNA-binding CsgD family transcriptional regulator